MLFILDLLKFTVMKICKYIENKKRKQIGKYWKIVFVLFDCVQEA